jgi:23S rRNA-/tRNA-specific pseudouridylate synthase
VADLEWTFEGGAAGVRLDKYLAGADRLGSRSLAAAALERGKVFLNRASAGLAEAGTRLAEGDLIRVWMDRTGSAREPAAGRPPADRLRILQEDDVLVVLDNPPGPCWPCPSIAGPTGHPCRDPSRLTCARDGGGPSSCIGSTATRQALSSSPRALRAHRLAVRHPKTGRPIRFEAPLPEDLLGLLDRLRRDSFATS